MLEKSMSKDPLVSIIIANYNGENYLKTCLKAVLASTYRNFEVFLVDDGSTDASSSVIKRFAKKDSRIKLLRNKVNKGAAASRNIAFGLVKGRYLFFLDNDTEVDKNCLKRLVEFMGTHNDIGGCQALIYDFLDRRKIQNPGVKLWAASGWGLPIARTKKELKKTKDYDIAAISAALMVRKEAFNYINGFDELEAVVTEDLDFSWRMWLSGYKIVLVPDAKIFHWTKSVDMRENLGQDYVKIYFHLTKNSILSIYKNYELVNMIKYLFASCVISLSRSLLIVIKRRSFSSLIGTVKGILWIIVNLSTITKMRKKVQSKRKLSDNMLFNKILLKDNWLSIYKRYYSTSGLL